MKNILSTIGTHNLEKLFKDVKTEDYKITTKGKKSSLDNRKRAKTNFEFENEGNEVQASL